jgi:HSP20 family molecular chaperone IbpA
MAEKKDKKSPEEEQGFVLSPIQPLKSETSVRKVINRLISETLIDSYGQIEDPELSDENFPSIDLSLNDKEITISAEVPGLKEEDLKLEINDFSIIISGEIGNNQEDQGDTFYKYERYFGEFNREIKLPVKVDIGSADASMKDGILTIVIGKFVSEKSSKESIKKIDN